MPAGPGFRAKAVRLACLGGVAALLAVPASAIAMEGPSSGLSPRLAELAKPSVRSASHALQAKSLGLPASGPASLLREGNRVLAYVRFDRGAAASVGQLRAAGAKIVDVSPRYQTVTVATKPGELGALAGVKRVADVSEALAPVTAAVEECPSGKVVSEGDAQLEAAKARAEFPVDGSGVTVGILSDSFDLAGSVKTHASEDEESGDLPGPESPCENKTPVDVLEDEKPKPGEGGPADEGRAMAQIVHDLAPGAKIAFASAFNGETSFAKNIEALAAAGAEAIADDVFYFEEPFFQDGPVAVAVDKVVSGGATYFSAAGNDNLFDSEGHEIASWETPKYRDAGSCPAKVQAVQGANGTHCLDFDPGSQTDKTFGIKVKPGAILIADLQWDEPWGGVGTDLDAFLLDASGNLIEEESRNNIKSKRPTEIIGWVNESASVRTVQLVINRFSGGNPRLKVGLLENGSGVAATEYPRSTGEDVVGPTIFGHSGAASAIAVGAVPFGNSNTLEKYSSRGPVRHDFGPVVGTEAAAPLGSPEILAKPDLVATDCGVTTFFASFSAGAWHFCGTSAAAPHAAGVAALMLDAEPAATPAEIRTALQRGARKVGAFGPCAIGAGLIDAVGAIEELPGPPPFVPTEECLPPEPEGSVEEARAPGDWGSEVPPTPPPPPGTQVTETDEPQKVTPRTFLRHRPRKVIRTRRQTVRVVFRFGSDQAGATFACRIDGGLFRVCPARLARRFGIGRHTLRVVARDASGIGDRSPATYRFRVKRIR